jgi:hypothetical protein
VITLAATTAPLETAQEMAYPRVIHTRYEAVEARADGQFTIWLERDKVWHGLDPRLPAVKYVDVTHLTPAPRSPPITLIEVTSINSTTPSFIRSPAMCGSKSSA